MRPSLRLAAYWAEVMGGPRGYSQACGDQSEVLRMHAGNGDMGDLGERFPAEDAAVAPGAAMPKWGWDGLQ